MWLCEDLISLYLNWAAPRLVINIIHNNDLIKQIKEKDERIKKLEDKYVKHQKRQNYQENVVYIISTKEIIKKNIYIIGKASNFKNRLSAYNKTSEHFIVYLKTCGNERNMDLAEALIINKLLDYKEKANRDRFILPNSKSINLFIDVIDDCVNFICCKPIILDESKYYENKSVKIINTNLTEKKIIDKNEEDNILKELANCDIVLQKNELNGIFSETDSDDFSDSDESDSENFYELTSVKNKKNKEINL